MNDLWPDEPLRWPDTEQLWALVERRGLTDPVLRAGLHMGRKQGLSREDLAPRLILALVDALTTTKQAFADALSKGTAVL